MTPAEWIGLLAVVVGVVGSLFAWMMRISRQLAAIEAIADRVVKVEDGLSRVADTVTAQAERLTVLESG